jgi:CspA family cold shock protein
VAKGKLYSFDAARGYGYIAPDDGGAKVFVHAEEFGSSSELCEGTQVNYSIIQGSRGPKAYNVRILGSTNLLNAPASAFADIYPELAPNKTVPETAATTYAEEITTILSSVLPGVTPIQLAEVRGYLLGKAILHGWLSY